MKVTRQTKLIWVMILWLAGCLEPYNPGAIKGNDNYLVVEGFLDVNQGNCEIRLSRSIALSQEDVPQSVLDATVLIEDSQSNRYLFTEGEDGRYILPEIQVSDAAEYRLVIEVDGKEYQSEFVPVTHAPPITEMNWTSDDKEVEITVSTRNLADQGTSYYLWNFTETWKYTSAFRSFFIWEDGDVARRNRPDELYYCWKSLESKNILLGNSVKLNRDVITDFPIQAIPRKSEKFQIKYSILARQFTLTKDAYEYWSQMRDNSQNTGGLYDKQPSRVTGNIRCLSNPFEPVLGYFGVYEYTEKRIFIERFDIPGIGFDYENDYQYCREDTLLLKDIPLFDAQGLLTGECIEIIRQGPTSPPVEKLLGYMYSSPFCVDCRRTGGGTTRPDFWED